MAGPPGTGYRCAGPARTVRRVDAHLPYLRSFLAVADEGSFSAAARALHLSQPALSRQVRQLERLVGRPLFHRTTRPVTLTDAGRVLLEEARPALDLLDSAVDAAGRVNDADLLTVAFAPTAAPLAQAATLAAFAGARPEVRVRMLSIPWSEQVPSLMEHRADVAFVHLPVDEAAVEVLVLDTAPRVVTLPAAHRLAPRAEVSVGDLAGEPVPVCPSDPPYWRDHWAVDPRPDGSSVVTGPEVHALAEVLVHVAGGRCVAVLPAEAQLFPYPGVVYRPVPDIPPGRTGLAWRRGSGSSAVADFVSAARAAADPVSRPG